MKQTCPALTLNTIHPDSEFHKCQAKAIQIARAIFLYPRRHDAGAPIHHAEAQGDAQEQGRGQESQGGAVAGMKAAASFFPCVCVNYGCQATKG